MANNYTQGATLVPSNCFVIDGSVVAFDIYKQLLEDNDGYLGIEVELWDDQLYIGTGESLDKDGLVRFLTAITEAKLLVKSFDLEFASYCDKLRPDNFGGCCVRVLPSGELLWFDTNLGDLTDEQFRYLTNVRERPSVFCSTPDA